MIRSLLMIMLFAAPVAAFAAGESVRLYKTPSCTCCDAYADYLRDNGFDVEVIPTHDLSAVKAEQGVPEDLAGCHTALIEGYVFEGHIPVDSVRRVLADRPDTAGISVPGMPVGSPGMGIERGLEEPLRVYKLEGGIYATYQRIPR